MKQLRPRDAAEAFSIRSAVGNIVCKYIGRTAAGVALVAAVGVSGTFSMSAPAHAANVAGPAIQLAKEGYFFVGGHYIDTEEGRVMVDQMFVSYRIPAHQTHPYPLVLFAGGGQSGLNYEGTADGREGWAQYFASQGYAVYVLDQPERGRSPYSAEDGGPTVRNSTELVERQFAGPEHINKWPQAKLHTQWPGAAKEGDPTFDQLMAQQFPSLKSFAKQQELNRDAGVALLEKIGPSVILAHSQSGTFAWLIGDARPKLVKAIIAVEPSGPPVHDLINKGSGPDWFEDNKAISKPYGLTIPPLAYDPPLAPGEQLTFVRRDKPESKDVAVCWQQAEPARKLINLEKIPVLMVQSEASYHAPYDYCTARYLQQAGVEKLTYTRLADIGIHGNGHMMMLEKNNLDVAAVMSKWLTSSGGE
jgi:pimeloyl-ACP methyl ester carboxylesterase